MSSRNGSERLTELDVTPREKKLLENTGMHLSGSSVAAAAI